MDEMNMRGKVKEFPYEQALVVLLWLHIFYLFYYLVNEKEVNTMLPLCCTFIIQLVWYSMSMFVDKIPDKVS